MTHTYSCAKFWQITLQNLLFHKFAKLREVSSEILEKYCLNDLVKFDGDLREKIVEFCRKMFFPKFVLNSFVTAPLFVEYIK